MLKSLNVKTYNEHCDKESESPISIKTINFLINLYYLLAILLYILNYSLIVSHKYKYIVK